VALFEKTNKPFIKFILLFAGIAFTLYFFYIFFDLIFLLIISIFLALIFNPLVKFIENRGISRLLSVLIVFVIGGVVIVFGFSVLIPKIAGQINMLSDSITIEKTESIVKQIEESLNTYLPFFNSEGFVEKTESFFSSIFYDTFNNITNILTSIFSVLAIAVIVPFMTFFLLKDSKSIVKGIVNIMPNKYFEFSYDVINKISHQLGRFVRGWIFDAFVVGLLAAIGLSILGIKNSITIGFIAGAGHLIPYFGPLIGGLPAIILSLIQFGDLSMLPQIVIMFAIIYSFDNGYLQPNIFSKSTDIHPLMIILLILMGSQLMGVIGMLLAVPTATVIKTAAREIYYGYKNYKIIRA